VARHSATTTGAGQSTETIRLADGRCFVLRPLRPGDLEALRRAFLRLTPEEIEYRFFYRSRELPASVMVQIRGFDPSREAALVVEGAGEIRAVADLHAESRRRARPNSA
jgi:acetyltransferase